MAEVTKVESWDVFAKGTLVKLDARPYPCSFVAAVLRDGELDCFEVLDPPVGWRRSVRPDRVSVWVGTAKDPFALRRVSRGRYETVGLVCGEPAVIERKGSGWLLAVYSEPVVRHATKRDAADDLRARYKGGL